MVRESIIAAKLAELAERAAKVRQRCPTRLGDLELDGDAQDLVAFNLMLCVQSCLDIASHVIADEGWPPAASLAEAFTRLAERGVIASATADAMGRASGLRNVVAHGYAGIELGMLHRAATTGLGDLDAFAREVSAWLSARPRE
jgi:uncharacterized protein YutE (UPF0331/DUF86 family)